MSEAESEVLTAPGPDRRLVPLSVLLRHDTRTVHVSTEAAFAVDEWLADRVAYAALLTLLQGFHRAAESALGGLVGWDELTPGIDLASRRRAFRIDQDLAALGRPAADPGAGPESGAAANAAATVTRATRPAPAEPMLLASLAEGLGCLYVVEGSSLGGRVIAERARAALGPGLPTAFFADPDRRIGQEWRALRATLDSFGAGTNAAAGQTVIDAARRTFAAFAIVLAGGRSRT